MSSAPGTRPTLHTCSLRSSRVSPPQRPAEGWAPAASPSSGAGRSPSMPCSTGSVRSLRPCEPFPRGCNLRDRLLARAPTLDGDSLALLQVLVDGEELLDLLAQHQRQLLELLVVVPVRIVHGHADDLVIDA